MDDWYRLEVNEVATKLETDLKKGRDPEVAKQRLDQYGPNELVDRGGKSPWKILLEQLTDIMVIILIVSAGISIFLQEYVDAIAILVIVILNATLGFTQEYKAEKAMASLKKMAVPKVKVRRGGHLIEGQAVDLVPGDVIQLDTGDAVPADCRLIESVNLRVQESVLTGESEPVEKSTTSMVIINISNMEREDAFSESDVRLLQTLANSMSVALENARLFDETQRLFKAEQERVAELEIINSIQQGLAAELDFQAIVDLVGDKIREVFSSKDLQITWYEEDGKKGVPLYFYEHGVRLSFDPVALTASEIRRRLLDTRQPVVWNTMAEGDAIQPSMPGTDSSRSGLSIPIIVSDKVVGSIGMENYEKDYAYGESDIRLLTTIAGSLGAALENARLFEETQRLLKETEQRAAELQIINSVQEGLATKLDIQAIYELVGDKISEIFKSDTMLVAIFDHEREMDDVVYIVECGERYRVEPSPLSDFEKYIIQNRKTVVVNNNALERVKELGMKLVDGTTWSKSGGWVPLLVGNQVNGMIRSE